MRLAYFSPFRATNQNSRKERSETRRRTEEFIPKRNTSVSLFLSLSETSFPSESKVLRQTTTGRVSTQPKRGRGAFPSFKQGPCSYTGERAPRVMTSMGRFACVPSSASPTRSRRLSQFLAACAASATHSGRFISPSILASRAL